MGLARALSAGTASGRRFSRAAAPHAGDRRLPQAKGGRAKAVR